MLYKKKIKRMTKTPSAGHKKNDGMDKKPK